MTSHPTAQIHPKAELAPGAEVGAYSVISEGVRVGEGTVIGAHVVVERGTIIGRNCHIFPGVVLGSAPQDNKYHGETSCLLIGDRNLIREHVTIHRATGEGQATVVGDDNMLMAYSHLGHNCKVGNQVTISNMVQVGGHTVIEDRVVVGGMSGVHQLVRIGRLAMVAGCSRVAQDVPPFCTVYGLPTKVCGLNVVGLRRAGVSPESRSALQTACRLLFRSRLGLTTALERIRAELPLSPEMLYLIEFMEGLRRGKLGRQLDRPALEKRA